MPVGEESVGRKREEMEIRSGRLALDASTGRERFEFETGDGRSVTQPQRMAVDRASSRSQSRRPDSGRAGISLVHVVYKTGLVNLKLGEKRGRVLKKAGRC